MQTIFNPPRKQLSSDQQSEVESFVKLLNEPKMIIRFASKKSFIHEVLISLLEAYYDVTVDSPDYTICFDLFIDSADWFRPIFTHNSIDEAGRLNFVDVTQKSNYYFQVTMISVDMGSVIGQVVEKAFGNLTQETTEALDKYSFKCLHRAVVQLLESLQVDPNCVLPSNFNLTNHCTGECLELVFLGSRFSTRYLDIKLTNYLRRKELVYRMVWFTTPKDRFQTNDVVFVHVAFLKDIDDNSVNNGKIALTTHAETPFLEEICLTEALLELNLTDNNIVPGIDIRELLDKDYSPFSHL